MAGRHDAATRRGGSFDAFDVARRRAEFAGTVDATTLARAADRLDDEGGAADVRWRIAGTADPSGRPALEVRLDGVVPLICQRCLQPFAWPVSQRTLLLLARDEPELAQLDAEDEHEVVLAAAPLDATTLVEDELLLTLPFAPRCERPACAGDAIAVTEAESVPAGESPFAVLAELKPGIAKIRKD